MEFIHFVVDTPRIQIYYSGKIRAATALLLLFIVMLDFFRLRTGDKLRKFSIIDDNVSGHEELLLV